MAIRIPSALVESLRTIGRVGYIVLVRPFRRSGRLRLLIGGAALLAVSFYAALWALDAIWPNDSGLKPKLVELPPLKAMTRLSSVTAPIVVANSAIRATLDAAAPRDFSGSNDNPISGLLSKADIGLTAERGPLTVTGRTDGLTIGATIAGSIKVSGQLATQAGNLTGQLGGLLNQALGQQVGNLASRVLDQKAEVKGQVSVTARPTFTPNWRIEPNLTGSVSIADGGLQIGGIKLNVGNEVKPMLDRVVSEQMSALQNKLRADPTIEQTARREWAKACRSIPLGGGKTGLPNLYLEMKPTRASAAQPKIDPTNVTLIIGIQAETRIVPTATKPNCPFPAQLEIVQKLDAGRVAIGVPIDIPFTEINKILEPQFKGRTFPDDKTTPYQVEIRKASLNATGNQLLIALLVKATERKSWFGFGAEATVHVLGKPVLDAEKQTLRLTDISLTVESEAAFGLLSAAARAAIPYVQDALAEHAVIDLKPFAADARTKIGETLAEFRQSTDGVRVDAAVNDLRMTGIEFDSKTLRVVAEATGTVRVAVNKLPGL
jgi:hypothetical protein